MLALTFKGVIPPTDVRRNPMKETAIREYDVVVVGAGFSGVCMLHRVLADGMTARAFESAPDVGGAWYWNRYPGARCDVESHDYSFSFDDDLQQEPSVPR
jgi:cyclohexanone monooxygenase